MGSLTLHLKVYIIYRTEQTVLVFPNSPYSHIYIYIYMNFVSSRQLILYVIIRYYNIFAIHIYDRLLLIYMLLFGIYIYYYNNIPVCGA